MSWTVITAGTKSYRHWIEQKQDACKRYGYHFVCWDLGGLGIGRPLPVQPIRPGGPRSPFKPRLILQYDTITINRRRWDDHIVWLDGDAELLQPLPELLPGSVSVAIHETTDQERTERGYAGWFSINAGVVMFDSPKDCREFCRAWQKALNNMPSGSDQDALNRLAWRWPFLGLLPARVFNNREGTDPDTIIRHYEGPKHRDLEMELASAG